MIVLPAQDLTQIRVSTRFSIIGLSLVAVAIVLTGEALTAVAQPTTAVVWSSLALAAYCTGLLFLTRATGQSDLGLARWKFGPWTLLWYSVAFGIATLTWHEPQVLGVATQTSVSSVLRALWLIAVGMTAWMVGYCAGFSWQVRSFVSRSMEEMHRKFHSEIRSLAAPWILYAFGIAARIASAASTGRFGYTGNVSSAVSSASSYGGILGALTLCAPLGLSAAAIQVFWERVPSARITLTVLLVVELIFGAVAGGKESFVIAVLAVVIPFSAARRKIPKKTLVGGIFIFLVIIIPFNQTYRSIVRQGTVTLTPVQAVSTAPEVFRQMISNDNVASALSGSASYLAQRILEINGPAIIMQRTPQQIPFENPIKLVEAPLASMIPRAIWPNKPIALTGYYFGQEYYGLPSTVYSSTADTIMGGLYSYGGWLPAIVGMYLLGSAVRVLDDCINVRVNPSAIYLVILLFPSLVGGENDWQTILSSLPAIILVWLFSVIMTFRIRRLE